MMGDNRDFSAGLAITGLCARGPYRGHADDRWRRSTKTAVFSTARYISTAYRDANPDK